MRIDLPNALLWGLFATGLLTLIMTGSQGLGWSRISLPYMLGTMFSPQRGRAMAIGFGLHLAFGCSFALLYAAVFGSWTQASWWTGGLLGLYHGIFMLVVFMNFLPDLHPRMAGKHHGPTPTRQLEPPGFMALNYGSRTPIITLGAHVLYGAIIGTFYHVPS
ncbi:MAG: hypothetical protein ACOC1F_10815 [Myxococcota bacterium]